MLGCWLKHFDQSVTMVPPGLTGPAADWPIGSLPIDQSPWPRFRGPFAEPLRDLAVELSGLHEAEARFASAAWSSDEGIDAWAPQRDRW